MEETIREIMANCFTVVEAAPLASTWGVILCVSIILTVISRTGFIGLTFLCVASAKGGSNGCLPMILYFYFGCVHYSQAPFQSAINMFCNGHIDIHGQVNYPHYEGAVVYYSDPNYWSLW